MAAKEIEVKIEVSSLENFKEKALNLGFSIYTQEHHEYNLVFDDSDNRFHSKRQLLRLRKAGNRNTITFKNPPESDTNKNYKIREEIESCFDNFENMRHILKLMGYKEVFVYEKFREVAVKQNLKIMFDKTPIGNFLELEGPPEDIDTIATKLGFHKEDYIVSDYLALFISGGGKGDMVF